MSSTRSAVVHELLDVISAVQHTIVDSLDGMSPDDIASLPSVAAIRQILENTVNVYASIGIESGTQITSSLFAQVRATLDSTEKWGGDWKSHVAQGKNEFLKQVPGITPQIIRGLLGDPAQPFWMLHPSDDVATIGLNIITRLRPLKTKLKSLAGEIASDSYTREYLRSLINVMP